MKFPTLQTQRFLLCQFRESDLNDVFEGLSNPDVIRYYGISFDSAEAAKAQMKWFKNLEETETGIWWAVCSPDNSRFYGAGGLSSLQTNHKKAEIGFWLLPEFWAQGIMTEVLPVICSFGFEQLGLHRIEGWVETENIRCKKAITKLNFIYEGTMKDCEIKNGRYISLEIYARFNTVT